MKRLLSLVVAFAMILSMVPNVFATETTEDQLPSDMETIGSLDNPEVLAELGYYSVTLASGDADGYYYAYTAVGEGTVSASVESVTAVVTDDNELEIVTASTEEETVTAAIALTNKTTGVTGAEVVVSEGDIVLIQVASSAAADVSWYGSFTYYAGHETNPIWLEIGENALTIPAGATVYYCGRFGGMTMSAVGEGLTLEHNGTTYTLTAEAQEFTCAQASTWDPRCTFVITNAGETELTCTLTVNYALGAMENPAALELGYNYATITEGSQGYFYTWTAEEAGTLSIEMPYDMGWAYAINNMTTYVYGDTQWSDSDPVVNPGTIEVAAGDKIQIMVNTYDAENPWTAPAGELAVYASFTAVPGTVNNPLWLEIGENVLTIPAGATVYYCGRFGGMIMSAVGEGLTLEHNGTTYTLTAEAQEFTCAQLSMWDPRCTFVITNDGESELTCTLTVNYPLGSMDNPEETYLGWTDVSLAEGDYDGYYYTYVAEGTGTITAWIGTITEGVTGDIVLTNTKTYAQRSLSADGVDNNGLEVTMDVTEGDVITIQVVVLPDENGAYPAAEIAWVANFTYPLGSENNPIMPEWTWNEAYTEATATVTVEAGATVYYKDYNSGMILTINGEEYGVLTGVGRNPAVFSITNDGEAAADYSLKIYWPVGSMENPAALEIGSNTAVITEGSQGYFYTWTATETGTLSIQMPSDMGWTYVINNVTRYIYGDIQWSDNNPVVNPGTVAVAAGDEVQIMVCTYDKDNPWTAPAGELTFTASFEAGTVIFHQPMDYTGLVGDTAEFAVVAAGEGLTYQWYYSTDNGETWLRSSCTESTYAVEFKAYRNNYMYRCVITDASGNTVTSKAAKLAAEEVELAIVTQPTGYTGAVNDAVSFAVEATGNGLVYQWYYSEDEGATWKRSNSTGSQTGTLETVLRTYRDGYQFYCQITDVFGNTVTSDTVSMVVKSGEIVIVTQPQNVDNGIVDQLYTFTVEATGENLTYRWYVSMDSGETWEESWNQGYESATLNVRLYEYRSGYQYRCVITSGLKTTVTSEAATLTLQAPSVEIVTQPVSVSAVAGKTISFHVEATGTDLTYQWFRSNDQAATWTETYLTGYNTDTLTFAANANRAVLYKCRITDGSGKVVWSDNVKLQILSAELQLLTQPVSVTCANGETATFTVEAQGDTLTYYWYVSADGGETWTNTYLGGYNTATLSFVVNANRAAKLYKCIVTDVAGNTVETDVVSVTIQ